MCLIAARINSRVLPAIAETIEIHVISLNPHHENCINLEELSIICN